MASVSKQSDVKAAYDAGRQGVLRIPRWRLFLGVILSIVIGNLVKGWVIARYSLSRSEAFLSATVAVILFASMWGVFESLRTRKGVH